MKIYCRNNLSEIVRTTLPHNCYLFKKNQSMSETTTKDILQCILIYNGYLKFLIFQCYMSFSIHLYLGVHSSCFVLYFALKKYIEILRYHVITINSLHEILPLFIHNVVVVVMPMSVYPVTERPVSLSIH